MNIRTAIKELQKIISVDWSIKVTESIWKYSFKPEPVKEYVVYIDMNTETKIIESSESLQDVVNQASNWILSCQQTQPTQPTK